MARNLRIQSLINSISSMEDSRMIEILSALNDESKDINSLIKQIQDALLALQNVDPVDLSGLATDEDIANLQEQIDNLTPSSSSSFVTNTLQQILNLHGATDDGEQLQPIPGKDGKDGISIIGAPGRDAEDPEEPLVIPGERGIDGVIGRDGLTIVLEPESPEDLLIVPGERGAAGVDGINGLMGPPGIAEYPEDPIIIPGARGADGAAGGGITYTAFTKDLGTARNSGTFDITGLAGLTPDKVVNIVQTMAPITSKGDARDEFEINPILLTGYVVDAATIRALWNSPNGVVVGDYNFAYAVSG